MEALRREKERRREGEKERRKKIMKALEAEELHKKSRS
jgi:hypothetical protein